VIAACRLALACAALLALAAAEAPAQRVVSRAGRIVYQPARGRERPLTTTGRDSLPALSPDGRLVAFVRDTPGDSVAAGADRCPRTELWLVGVDGAGARRVLRGRAADDRSRVIGCIHRPTFSPDGRWIFFESEAWVTSAALHRVEVATGREQFVCPSNGYEWIRRGRYDGALLVMQHRSARDRARDGAWIVTPQGRTVRRVAYEDERDYDAKVDAVRAGRLP
jgi:Tol biopolymer transport system component